MDADHAWRELLIEARNLKAWEELDGRDRAVARIRAALRDYDASLEGAA